MKNSAEIRNLIDTDREFARISITKGAPFAFDQFVTEDAVIFRDNSPPIEGRDQIRKSFEQFPDAILIWEPYRAEVGAGGDLGFTMGKWTLSSNSNDSSSQSQGHYISIWRKQPDGNWKYIFDSGITTPD